MKVESALAVLRGDDAFYENHSENCVTLVCLMTLGTLCPQTSEVSTCEHTKPVLLLG